MSNCCFSFFSRDDSPDDVRRHLLCIMESRFSALNSSLGWVHSCGLLRATGEVTDNTAPYFTIGLSIFPDECYVSERERLFAQHNSNSAAAILVKKSIDASNAILTTEPYTEEGGEAAVQLLKIISVENQPSIIGLNSGEIIYDATGQLLLPEPWLPKWFTRLFASTEKI
jgi:hypothetical protein